MKIHNLIVVITVTLFPYLLFSQAETQPFSEITIEGRLLDKKSNNPIAYAHIYNKTTAKGTISNLEGYFKLNIKSLSDIVQISMIGYKNTQLFLDSKHNFYQVYLEESMLLLKEVKVIAEDKSYLYDLLNDCKKHQSTAIDTSKVYYELKSFVDSQQVELVECFYNGTLSGYDLEDLELKYGRIALQTQNKKLFVSVETSRVISMMKLFDRNQYLPYSPLELSKRKLKKQYFLNLENKYYNDNHDSIYIVKFSPKDTFHNCFNGQVWINYSKKSIVKIKLICLNASEHPFQPISASDNIKNVDMEITKTFQDINGKMFFKHIDFMYHITYKNRENNVYKVSTNAVLYSYDHNTCFSFPYFQFASISTYSTDWTIDLVSNTFDSVPVNTFSSYILSDYLKINAMPYNEFFWENNEELKLNEEQNKNELFYEDPNSITNRAYFPLNQIIKKGLSEHPYLTWSKNRIRNRDFTIRPPTSKAPQQPNSLNNQYQIEELCNLSVKIFLDVNSLKDSFHFITATVLDPYESYYNFPLNNRILCFVNIYFDLIEIERRTLESEIEKSDKKIESINKLYKATLVKIEQLNQKYFKDGVNGKNKNEMEKWNNIVFNSLGINNMELFKPDEDEKKEQH
jgi:hypothetical protein